MSGLKSVMLAIEVAAQKRDRASRYLVQIRHALLFAQDQKDQLESYAIDAEVKWTSVAQVSTTPELMRHHYQFMERLYHAIGLQDGVLNDQKQQVEIARKQLLEAEIRLAGLKQVLKKKQAELVVLQTRREQRQTDEFATQQHSRSLARQRHGE